MDDVWLDTNLSNEDYWRLKKERRMEEEHELLTAMIAYSESVD